MWSEIFNRRIQWRGVGASSEYRQLRAAEREVEVIGMVFVRFGLPLNQPRYMVLAIFLVWAPLYSYFIIDFLNCTRLHLFQTHSHGDSVPVTILARYIRCLADPS